MSADLDLRECLSCSCFAARRAARVITQHYDRHLRPSGLRSTQFTVLVVLTLSGPQPLSRLADLMATERTTLTRNLRVLIARGLLRELDHDDQRVRMLAVTRKGAAAARAALPLWRKAQSSVTAHLGADSIQGLSLAANAASGLVAGPRNSKGRKKEDRS